MDKEDKLHEIELPAISLKSPVYNNFVFFQWVKKISLYTIAISDDVSALLLVK